MRPARRPLLVACAAAVCLAGAPHAAPRDSGTLRGRVTFAESVAPVEPRPSVSDLGGGRRAPVDRRKCVVYLQSAPREAFDELRPARARMDQRNEEFVPRVLAITTGTTVEFPNSDSKFHNVFSLSTVKTFDLGLYAPGHTGSIRFDTSGIVRVFCDIHSHMSAFILVFNHPFFSTTDESGRYTIPGVPAGAYTLMVWSELGHAEPRRITVTDGGVTEMDFQIGRMP